MRLLDEILEIFGDIRIKRLRGHEEDREVLRLAGNEVAFGNVANMLADVGADAGGRRFLLLG